MVGREDEIFFEGSSTDGTLVNVNETSSADAQVATRKQNSVFLFSEAYHAIIIKFVSSGGCISSCSF